MEQKILVLAGVLGGVLIGTFLLYQRSKSRRKEHLLVGAASKTKKDMVDQLVKVGVIKQDRVATVMMKVDRINYMPQDCRTPYNESGYPIGYNATISAPHMHALGLDLLASRLVNGAIVLDIGSGSGYMTACMAALVAPNGRVYGVEHVKELVDSATANILKDSPSLISNIMLTVGDGLKGLPSYAPYNVIYAGAASEYVPQELVDQLAIGGRMLIPVGPPDGFHSLVQIDKGLDGAITKKNMGPVRFIPLQAYEKQIDGSELGVTKIMKGGNNSDLHLRTRYYPAPDTNPDDIKIIKSNLGI